MNKVKRIKQQKTGHAHQQFSIRICLTGCPIGIDQTVQLESREVRVIEACARSKFCRHRTTLVFRQRGVLHSGVNQHDMVIRIRHLRKLAIARLRASFSRCERPSDYGDFLAFTLSFGKFWSPWQEKRTVSRGARQRGKFIR